VLPRIAPMKAVTGDLPVDDAWGFEVKWDGMLH
jgi:ATP-dependent DNA ligase